MTDLKSLVLAGKQPLVITPTSCRKVYRESDLNQPKITRPQAFADSEKPTKFPPNNCPFRTFSSPRHLREKLAILLDTLTYQHADKANAFDLLYGLYELNSPLGEVASTTAIPDVAMP